MLADCMTSSCIRNTDICSLQGLNILFLACNAGTEDFRETELWRKRCPVLWVLHPGGWRASGAGVYGGMLKLFSCYCHMCRLSKVSQLTHSGMSSCVIHCFVASLRVSSTACHKQGCGGILYLLNNMTNHSMATALPLSSALNNLNVFVNNCETDIYRHRFIGSVGMHLARQFLCSLWCQDAVFQQ